MGKLTAFLVACIAMVLTDSGAAHAKRHGRLRAHKTAASHSVAQSGPAAADQATPTSPAAGSGAALAPAPSSSPAGLTGLLDSIFKPQTAALPAVAPVAAAASAASPDAPVAGLTSVGRASPLRELAAKHAAANGVPFALAHAVIMIESKYAARVAHAGNYGLMQIRAQTARGMGFSGSAAGLLDPETNLRFGMKYLGLAYRLARGDTCGTLMRYQSGVGTTRMSASNRAYCAHARSLMAGI